MDAFRQINSEDGPAEEESSLGTEAVCSFTDAAGRCAKSCVVFWTGGSAAFEDSPGAGQDRSLSEAQSALVGSC